MRAARALLAVVIATLGRVPSTTGLACLEPPQNVSVHVVNTIITLKWDWDNPCVLNVTFSAWYKETQDGMTWIAVPECQNLTATECDLSLLELDYLCYYNVNVRVDTGKESSAWASFTFSPYITAQIGPPGVVLEPVDGYVKIKIIHPEENQAKKMWELENLSYKLAIWKNSSKPEKKYQDVFSGQNLPDLQPNTTYCLEVKAFLEYHKALWSPTYCTKTPKALDGLACPTNLHVHALNMKYILYWDSPYNGNVTFMAQWLFAYKRESSHDYSENWITIPGCENIPSTHCDFSSSVSFIGIFYLRVRTMNSHSRSPWSELKFEPLEKNEIGPPSVKVNASEDSLRIFIIPPGEMENNSMSEYYYFTYHVWYWNNSSNVKEKVEEKSTSFIIPKLSPSTIYCLEVQAVSPIKSSNFSNVTCIATAGGKPYQVGPVLFIVCLIGGVVLGAGFLYAVWYIWKKIEYVFFPSCNLPSVIEKTGGRDLSSSYLVTSEETTEKCVLVIENSITAELNQINGKDYRQSEKNCRDSGNYSNEDDISGSKESREMKQAAAV